MKKKINPQELLSKVRNDFHRPTKAHGKSKFNRKVKHKHGPRLDD